MEHQPAPQTERISSPLQPPVQRGWGPVGPPRFAGTSPLNGGRGRTLHRQRPHRKRCNTPKLSAEAPSSPACGGGVRPGRQPGMTEGVRWNISLRRKQRAFPQRPNHPHPRLRRYFPRKRGKRESASSSAPSPKTPQQTQPISRSAHLPMPMGEGVGPGVNLGNGGGVKLDEQESGPDGRVMLSAPNNILSMIIPNFDSKRAMLTPELFFNFAAKFNDGLNTKSWISAKRRHPHICSICMELISVVIIETKLIRIAQII